MKKLKLLFAACTLMLGVSNAWAQTDVTSQYITNADFSSTDGWTANSSSGFKAQGNGLIGTYGVRTDEGQGVSTIDATHLGTESCFGFEARWSPNFASYQQTVTLPEGNYLLCYDVENTNSNTTGSINYESLFYVQVGETKYSDSVDEWMKGNSPWTKHTIPFTLNEETSVTISLGYGTGSNNYSSANTPTLHVSHLSLMYSADKQFDYTSSVAMGKDNWAGSGTYGSVTSRDGRTSALAEFYGSSDAGTKLSQKVTGLRNGIYDVTVYATSHNAWGNHGATLSEDADDVAYIFAAPEGGTTLTQYFTARKDGGMSAIEPFKVTISGVAVEQGSMTIGLALAKSAQTEWQTMQIYSLTRTAGLDLSGLISAYEAALANAKAVDKTKKMRASILTALQDAISTYDEGKVDKEDADALETATSALETATANANTSIASYAIIAAGSIPDNSLDGWVCENTNTFHINTWSTEGNSDGSNMKTPFIENWVGKGSYLGAGKVYYQLSGLEPNEVYYAQALVRSYNEANSDAPNGPNFFINDVITSLSEAGTTFTYNNMSGIYATLGGAATVGQDGVLKLGVEIANDRNYNWVAFKSVSIRPMDDAFDAAVEKVTALEGAIPTAAYNAAYAVVEEWKENYPTNAIGFETAISEIEAAAATAAECKAPYAAYYALNNKAYSLSVVNNDNKDANDAFNAAMMNLSINLDKAKNPAEIDVITSNLKDAMQTYVFAANPVGDGAQFDCTFLLTNPDLTGFPDRSKAEGWYTDQDGGNSQVMTNESVAGSHGATFFEYWSGSAAANNKFTLYQKVTLPEGTYSISCDAFASPNDVAGATTSAVYFYANDTQGSLVDNQTLTASGISFKNSTEQEVKIGLKALEGNQFRWMGIGYVELYKVPAKTYTVSEDVAWDNTTSGAGDVTLTRTIKKGFNTLVLPFSMTQAEVVEKFGTGSVVYTLKSFEDGVIRFNKADGISPNKPCILEATVEGTSYELEDRTIVAGDANPTSTVGAASLIGSYADLLTVEKNAYNYVVSNGALYLVDSDVTIKGTRAYFNVPESLARTISMSFDDDVTGIATVENGEVKNVITGDIYDLQGRKVKNPSKGIYVVEGKKVVF